VIGEVAEGALAFLPACDRCEGSWLPLVLYLTFNVLSSIFVVLVIKVAFSIVLNHHLLRMHEWCAVAWQRGVDVFTFDPPCSDRAIGVCAQVRCAFVCCFFFVVCAA
jgi:hypothetical protein